MSSQNPRARAPQQRSQETRDALLATAMTAFTEQGYEGTSIRALESAADVQHGAVTYHFKNKEGLWKATADHLSAQFSAYIEPIQNLLGDLDDEAALKTAVTALVRFSAHNPEFSRLMSQEGARNSWRMQYLVDSFLRDGHRWVDETLGLKNDPHTYYILIGAMTQVFDVAEACSEIFGVDPTSDAFVKTHAARVARMLIALKNL